MEEDPPATAWALASISLPSICRDPQRETQLAKIRYLLDTLFSRK